MPQNEQINLSGEELLTALREIELILISLHKIGSYYFDKDQEEYARETCRFVDDWKVTHRLALIRSILCDKFDLSLGEDQMDDIEREMQRVDYWQKPGDLPIEQ